MNNATEPRTVRTSLGVDVPVVQIRNMWVRVPQWLVPVAMRVAGGRVVVVRVVVVVVVSVFVVVFDRVVMVLMEMVRPEDP